MYQKMKTKCFSKSSLCGVFQYSFVTFFNVLISVLLNAAANGQRLVVYPCVDTKAIDWIRDPDHCDQYYICHFGQPLSMPACPKGQVWATSALNCVPVGSRWDDCDSETRAGYYTYNNKRIDDSLQDTSTVFQLPRSRNSHNNRENNVIRGNNRIISLSPNYHHNKSSDNFFNKKESDIKRYKYVQSKLATPKPTFTPRRPTNMRRNRFHKDPNKDNGQSFTTLLPTTTTPSITSPPTLRTSFHLYRDIQRQYNKYIRTKQPTWEDKNRFEDSQNEITPEHRCVEEPGAFLPHPDNCHWYYNCSLANLDDIDDYNNNDEEEEEDIGDEDIIRRFIRLQPYRVRRAGVFVWECRYPQLFDHVTHRCREFINVDCGSRFEPVDQCEYSQRECHSDSCNPCEHRFGRCRDKLNGIYPIQSSQWNQVFMTCYQRRNIAQDRCQPPTPIFSPETLDCVSLFEVPKANGGLLPDCSTRPDGYYPDEQGRCAIFFRCSLGQFRGYDECPPASVFDPAIPACQPFSLAPRPCGDGQAPLCGGKFDGMYADPYGRCTHFFQCTNGVFQAYFSCDVGMFDPLSQTCVLSAEDTLRPCGLKPSPCETLPTGVYPDQDTSCRNFIECHDGILITNSTCDDGRVFSAISGRCDLPEKTPPPCGVASTCLGRRDGRYPALSRGCSFFFECYHGEFISLRRCAASDGGFFFNPATGRCDYPQNICPPCGYRWWGCAQNYSIRV